MPESPSNMTPKLEVASVEAALQLSVSLHWLAVEQYTVQAEHLARWGYSKLAEDAREDAEEERGHLRKLLARLEFYDIDRKSTRLNSSHT